MISLVTHYLPVFIIHVVLLHITGASYKPPMIDESVFRLRNIFFKDEGTIEIPCAAEGNPSPVYSWLKDGVQLDLESEENAKRMSLLSGVGTLRLKPATNEDEGAYQCQARNAHGLSVSVVVKVQEAKLDPFRTVEVKTLRPILSQSVKLECVVPFSVPRSKIQWVLGQDQTDYEAEDSNDQKAINFVDLDDRVTMDYSGNLYITNVKPEDAQGGNKYVCMATNSNLRLSSQGDDKIIQPLGNVTKIRDSNMPVEMLWHSDTDVMGMEGRVARFKCIFSGNPQPKITWIRIDAQSDPLRMKESSDTFEYVIKDVQYSDEGEYECSGFNGIYKDPIKHRFRLIVEAKPLWVKKPVDIEAGVEEDATFLCEGKGRPEPDVQWYINGQPIQEAANLPRRTFRKGQLMFKKLEKMDSQVIQCNVSNSYGFLWADVYLNVLAIPASVVKKPLALLKVAEEQTVTITCQTTGKPTPEVIWFKGDQQLSGGRYKILSIGDLVISSLRTKDSGNYRCFVRNIFGKDQANGTLIVREKTRISDEYLLNLKPVHGTEAVFKCHAVTDPSEHHRLKYTWLRDGQPVIIDNDRIIADAGDLIIKYSNTQDTGNYTCIVSNGLDEDRAWATLKVKAPPDPPYNISVLVCVAREATIIWSFDESRENFSPVQNFILEYNTSYAADHWEVRSRPSANQRQATIHLSPFAHYNFRVKAVNRIGVGLPSLPTQTICQTPMARPDRHPENVRTVGDKTNYLVIEWEPMKEIELNAEGFFYNITVQKVGDEQIDSYIIDDHKIGRKEIPVETIYEPYLVTVQAQNQVGFPLRDATPLTGYSGQAEPLVVPENFELDPDKNVTATSAGFQWNPVDTSPEVIQGVFTGYKVRVWKKDQQETSMTEIFIPHTPSTGRRQRRQNMKVKAEVHNLASYSDLEADVVATNSHFSSNGSNIVNFTTPEGVPTKVSYFEAVSVGSTHFTLAWGEPKEKNGIITGYDLGYQVVDGIMYKEEVNASELGPRTRRTYLGGLQVNTKYRLFIAGRTQYGKGSPYYIDVKTAEKGVPLAKPKILEIHPRPDSANVTWELPDSEGKRVGAKYFINYRKFGLSQWNTHHKAETMNMWQVVDNLEAGMVYEVRIVAKSGKPGDLDYAEMASERRTFETGGVAAKRSSILSAGWFIGMMVAIAILLLILIIVCIIKRNRGDKYHVQEKERLRGSNQEDPAENFNELGKSDTNGIGQSSSFENNPEKMPLGDETDSMEEYGDVDPAKFNEDGSFIGEYGGQKGGGDQQASTMATLA